MNFAEFVVYDPTSPSGLVWLPGKGWGQNKGSLPAGSCTQNGYWVVSIAGKSYRAHHVVWALHGNPPVKELDHVNRNRGDNRIENLRPVSRSQNNMNNTRRHLNKFGVKGLSLVNNTWRGRLHKDGKTLTFCSPSRSEVEHWLHANRSTLHKEYASYA